MPRTLSCGVTVSHSPHQVSSDLGGEVVLLNVASGVYYGLDPIGARVWELIQEPRRVAAIRDTLVEEYDVAPDRCEQELMGLLGELADEGLIVVEHGVVT